MAEFIDRTMASKFIRLCNAPELKGRKLRQRILSVKSDSFPPTELGHSIGVPIPGGPEDGMMSTDVNVRILGPPSMKIADLVDTNPPW